MLISLLMCFCVYFMFPLVLTYGRRILPLTMLWKSSASNILKYLLCFSQKIGFDIAGKLSPKDEMLYPILW